MGTHRKKDNLRLRGSQTTAFLQSQPQLNDGLQAADFPLGSPLQRVLPSPALSMRPSMRLPHLDVHGLLQLSVYDTDHIHHLSLAPASLQARFLSQRMAAGGNPPAASLSTLSNLKFYSFYFLDLSLIRSPLTIPMISSLVQAPTIRCLPKLSKWPTGIPACYPPILGPHGSQCDLSKMNI